MKLHALFLVFGLVAADISAQLFEQAGCTLIDDNEIVANVHSDESDKFGSKCQAPGPFKSVNIVSIDAGFQCNYCCSCGEHSQSAHKNECYCYLSEPAVDTYRGKENRYM
jgi:hypothetical protein